MEVKPKEDLAFNGELHLLQKLFVEGFKVTTLAPVGAFMWQQVTELGKLKDLSLSTSNLIQDLRLNRDNLEYCQSAYQSYWKNCTWFYTQAENWNEMEFDLLLGKLEANTTLINDSLAKLQQTIDNFGIALIAVNITFIYKNINFYLSAESDIKKYKEELSKIENRLERCVEWFKSTNQDQEKRTHFYANLGKIIADLKDIKLRLEILRSSAVSTVIQSVGSAALVAASVVILPVSSTIFTLGLASSVLNVAVGAGLGWKVIDSIDRLIPQLDNIVKAYEQALLLSVKGDNSLPVF